MPASLWLVLTSKVAEQAAASRKSPSQSTSAATGSAHNTATTRAPEPRPGWG